MPRKGAKRRFLRFLPLLIFAGGIVLFLSLDGASYLDMKFLRENRQLMQELVTEYGFLAQLGYTLLYIVSTAFSLPIGTLLTITAGFFFGPVIGTVIVVCGATIGSLGIFLAVQMGIGESLTKGAETWVVRMRTGFQKNAFSYLLMLRLIPLFPFALVNIVPALLGVRPATYIVATFIGIIPGSFVYVLLGNGLGAVFDAGGTADIGLIFQPEILFPILGLALLVLLQLVYRKFREKREAARSVDS